MSGETGLFADITKMALLTRSCQPALKFAVMHNEIRMVGCVIPAYGAHDETA